MTPRSTPAVAAGRSPAPWRETADSIERFASAAGADAHSSMSSAPRASSSARRPSLPVRVRPTIGPTLPATITAPREAIGHTGLFVRLLVGAGLALAAILGLVGGVGLP